jgi:hypothetical protein
LPICKLSNMKDHLHPKGLAPISYYYIGWFGLWCLMPLSTIFQLYRGSQFYWWRKSEYPIFNLSYIANEHLLFYLINYELLSYSFKVVYNNHRQLFMVCNKNRVCHGRDCIYNYLCNQNSRCSFAI